MDNYIQKGSLDFHQNVNRFIGYGVTLSIIYSYFYAPFAFFFLLPFMLWGLSSALQISKDHLIEKGNKISIFESTILILLFASAYAIYLILINSIGIGALYYSSNNLDNIDIFLRVISAPIMEEIIFRGFGIGILKKYGKIFSIVATSLLFAFLHYGIRVIMVMPSALMYGVIMILTKNILFPIIMHMIVNAWFFSWSSFNILVQLFSKNQVVEHWINVPVSLALNCAVIIVTLIILGKKPFFKELLYNCKFSSIVTYIKLNKNIYKIFFSLVSVKIFLIIAVINSLYNIIKAIQQQI